MKIEHLLLAAALYLYLHYLLAKPDLNPTLRGLLQPLETKALTRVFADFAAVV